MKVLMVNGSRREKMCTYTALSEVAKELEARGIDTEIVFIGERAVDGQIDELVKEVAAKANARVQELTAGKNIVKVICVPDKLVNVVVK